MDGFSKLKAILAVAKNGEYEKSIGILKKCLSNFNRMEFPRNKEIKLRIIYTLTKCLHLTYEHVEAIKYSRYQISH